MGKQRTKSHYLESNKVGVNPATPAASLSLGWLMVHPFLVRLHAGPPIPSFHSHAHTPAIPKCFSILAIPIPLTRLRLFSAESTG
ncbi:uncharacterized protein LY79DRAFT_571213 [Colletotrichum navitas]|uniref:Uncharacterized protein n=1 Tax=Colletotrichum navitas TaxID=681940 RepID=A0AAD8UZC0_9PEZI|nr:uncharacterized protein LY79DRAFT_571213 [Colletotrichum navitas]KAK1569778.1 hypothetical protein LY79DRAFT_571213 [Colletotrichum navitas]